ncbi:hypothetical protein [Paenarthrobacter sp. MSM-2-10-13]|nr:hypothetical protein [Paenarthrobacter sp. MSM-2-10-13]
MPSNAKIAIRHPWRRKVARPETMIIMALPNSRDTAPPTTSG